MRRVSGFHFGTDITRCGLTDEPSAAPDAQRSEMLNGNDDKLLPAVKIAPAKGVGCMAVLGRKAYCMAV
jgi:hypothetical protein